MSEKERVLVAMSGGIDSTAAAFNLQESGYAPEGVTMIMWSKAAKNPFRKEAEKAAESCRRIGIPHHILDLQQEFESEIVKNFAESYLAGLTPNPCVLCNRAVKWRHLLQFADKLGIEKVATGHYAQLVFDEGHRRFALYKASDERKDQTYMLWRLSQSDLACTLFPLADVTKPEVRSLTEKFNLTDGDSIDSQDICFLPDNDYRGFLLEYCRNETAKIGDGEIVTEEGKVIGTHKGFFNYTIGQRKGLGIAAGVPVYVKTIDAANNRVVVSGPDSLGSPGVLLEQINWVSEPEQEEVRGTVRIRYNHKGAAGTARWNGTTMEVRFDEPQRAVTPGQSAVIYRDNKLICGGFITRAL